MTLIHWKLLLPDIDFVNFDDFERKLREFVSIYDQFLSKSKKIQGIKNIDLRYPTGFAVH